MTHWRDLKKNLEAKKVSASPSEQRSTSIPGVGLPESSNTVSKSGPFNNQPQPPSSPVEANSDLDKLMALNSLNSKIYSELIPTGSWHEAEKLYNEAIAFDVGAQTTNLMCNFGIVLYLQGKIDEAIGQFNRALNRKDRYAESEASWFLARVYSERGDDSLSAVYEEKCRKSGGYSTPEFLTQGVDIEGDDPYFVRVIGSIGGKDLHSFIKFLTQSENEFHFQFVGSTFVTQGMMGIAGQEFPSCPSCIVKLLPDEGLVNPEQLSSWNRINPGFNCDQCGRNPSNYIAIRPGNGISLVTNADIYCNGSCIGTLSIPDLDFFETMVKQLSPDTPTEGSPLDVQPFEHYFNSRVFEHINAFPGNGEPIYWGTIENQIEKRWSNAENPFSGFFFGEHGEGIDSLTGVDYSKNTRPGLFDVFAYCGVGEKGDCVPVMILTLRNQFVQDSGFHSVKLDDLEMQNIYDLWKAQPKQIASKRDIQAYSATSNSKIFALWSQNTEMGQAFQNDFVWLSLSWNSLAEILDDNLPKYEGTPSDKAISLRLRGLYSRSNSLAN